MSETIEQKTARTILQKPLSVKVGDKTYLVAPPSVATLIMVSEEISLLPHTKGDGTNLLAESLAMAKDCGALGNIIAIFILGAKTINADEEERQKRRGVLYRLFHRSNSRIDRKTVLARELMENLTPTALHQLCASILQRMEIADFFGLTTFLIEVNQLKPTREVETTTAATQSGA